MQGLRVCFGTTQSSSHVIMQNVFKEGIPDMNDFDGTSPNLVIIDDLMRESDGRVVDWFTKGCHHRNISVFFITQNLFHQAKGARDISLTTHYIVCFKNPAEIGLKLDT